jgi:hypothetical protein
MKVVGYPSPHLSHYLLGDVCVYVLYHEVSLLECIP